MLHHRKWTNALMVTPSCSLRQPETIRSLYFWRWFRVAICCCCNCSSSCSSSSSQHRICCFFSSCVCLLSCWFGHNTVRVLVLCRHRARPTKNSIELNCTELNGEHRCSIFSLRRCRRRRHHHRVRYTHSKRQAYSMQCTHCMPAQHSSICS